MTNKFELVERNISIPSIHPESKTWVKYYIPQILKSVISTSGVKVEGKLIYHVMIIGADVIDSFSKESFEQASALSDEKVDKILDSLALH
jgi:hypothetical protein